MVDIISEKAFIRDFANDIINNTASVFIGSGVSRDAGYVDWKDLLKEVAEDINLDVDKETDLISLAEYYVNSRKNRVKINQAISKYFSEEKSCTNAHKILASLPIISYWTTNYDKLIEKSFDEKRKSYSVLTNDNSFKKFIEGKDVVIHKLHGDVDNPGEAVITKKDYEEFAYKHEILLSKLKGEMCSKTFLFLGYSFSDTDIKHILSRIRLFYKGDFAREHYCVLENLKLETDKDGNIIETEEEFEYRKTRQNHHIQDLKSYGIQTILVNDYSEDIPRILSEIRMLVCQNNVFISGAYEKDDVQKELGWQLARSLSTWFITENMKIYSGYGNNIGPEVVAGVYDGYRLINKNKHIANRYQDNDITKNLSIHPFPYISSSKKIEKESLYRQIRENILQNTQIMIIIGGNKMENGVKCISDGVLMEYEIAKDKNQLIIPIAATGGAAEVVWDEMFKENSYYVKSKDFIALKNGKNFEEIFEAVKNIIKTQQNRIS